LSAAVTTLDAATLRRWCAAAAAGLRDARAEIDALNVFPVPDGDTGTNLMLTMAAAADAAQDTSGNDVGDVARAVSRAALLAARGNAGIILSEFLRGAGTVLAAVPRPAGMALADALGRAAEAAYSAVERPVDGTMLTVLRAAADAAKEAGSDDLVKIASLAAHAAEQALARTPEQLPALAAAGVVDAGGRGVCVVLDALHAVVSGEQVPARPVDIPVPPAPPHVASQGPAFEVMYLLDTAGTQERSAVPALRERLAALGNCLLVVGGDGLWNVHVHVDDVGAAIEAGLDAGRPYRIRVTHFATQIDGRQAEPLLRRVVAIIAGDGMVELLERAGAQVVDAGTGAPSMLDLLRAIEQTGATDVVILPGMAGVAPVAEVAARHARATGVRVAVVPATEPVQALAALAVHDASRPFDDDVIAMTAAARVTRAGALLVAQDRAITNLGMVEIGQVIGLVDGEVVALGESLTAVATSLLDSMLYASGELVTLVLGRDCPADIADVLAEHVRIHRPEVEVVVYSGQQASYPLLIGVE
jgi:uncharacterized protein